MNNNEANVVLDEVDGPQRIDLSPSDTLTKLVMSQLSEPAILFPGKWIERTMEELCTGIPLAHLAPYKKFTLPFAPPFMIGTTYYGNRNESKHLHPQQFEAYIPVKGTLRVACWYGLDSREYLLGPGDLLLVPPGCWHYVDWVLPANGQPEGWCWVIKSPNNLTGMAAKIEWKDANGS